MKLEVIEREELTQSQRDVLARDRERWKPMSAGAHLDDWLSFGEGLLIRRRLAMRIAHTNEPKGRGYNEAFAALMQRDGLHTMDKTSVSAVLWLHDDSEDLGGERLAVLREIREGMTPSQRARLNSPISARQRVELALKVKTAGNAEQNPAEPPARVLKRQIADKDRELAELREENARLKQRLDSDLPVNLRHNGQLRHPRDIATEIASRVPVQVAADVAHETAEAIKRLSNRRAAGAGSARSTPREQT